MTQLLELDPMSCEDLYCDTIAVKTDLDLFPSSLRAISAFTLQIN